MIGKKERVYLNVGEEKQTKRQNVAWRTCENESLSPYAIFERKYKMEDLERAICKPIPLHTRVMIGCLRLKECMRKQRRNETTRSGMCDQIFVFAIRNKRYFHRTVKPRYSLS